MPKPWYTHCMNIITDCGTAVMIPTGVGCCCTLLSASTAPQLQFPKIGKEPQIRLISGFFLDIFYDM